jgi:adenylate kinase
MNIVFLGAPGSGKGTQASLISKELKINIISTGNLLREEVESKTKTGELIKKTMESGDLVSDEIVMELIKDKILKFNDGFILDGFPRNINQAHKLDEMLTKINKKIHKVFSFEIDDEIIIKRLSGRYSCKKCGTIYNKYYSQTKIHGYCDKCNSIDFETRSDDNETTIKKRLEVFKESSFPLIDYYKKKHLLVSINALKMVSLIFEDIKTNINH